MIKYIIRKVQRAYKQKYGCRKDERFVKYGQFKSMNMAYMRELFSDSSFSLCFEDLSQSLNKDFETEDDNRVLNILEILSHDIKKAVKCLGEKNKMPWPKIWKKKLINVYVTLFKDYVRNANP